MKFFCVPLWSKTLYYIRGKNVNWGPVYKAFLLLFKQNISSIYTTNVMH